MGYTIYWRTRRQHTDAELKKYNKIWNTTYKREIAKIARRGLSTAHYEWAGKNPMSNRDFEFMKTARTPYDYAVKKALMAVQKASKNGWKITCDDGFIYIGSGLKFNPKAYMEDYQPATSIPAKFKLSDLPIKYRTKGGFIQENGRYDWNENKRAKMVGTKTRPKKMIRPKRKPLPKKAYPQTGSSDTLKDSMLQAKKSGWRYSDSGNKYFENRRNRSDKGKWL